MKEIRFVVRQTGYDSEDTRFLVTCKNQGTAPDINVYTSGAYEGHLVLSQRGAKELVQALAYLVGMEVSD
jgi:hypothetical protein